MGPFLKA